MTSLDDMKRDLRENYERLGLREKVQSFVEQVCGGEGWETPRVEIPSWEEWYDIGIMASDGLVPSEKVWGWSRPSQKRIYINPRHVTRMTVLHELYTYNMPREVIMEFLEDPVFKKHPELLHGSIEMRVDSEARRLGRKYRDEWRRKVE